MFFLVKGLFLLADKLDYHATLLMMYDIPASRVLQRLFASSYSIVETVFLVPFSGLLFHIGKTKYFMVVSGLICSVFYVLLAIVPQGSTASLLAFRFLASSSLSILGISTDVYLQRQAQSISWRRDRTNCVTVLVSSVNVAAPLLLALLQEANVAPQTTFFLASVFCAILSALSLFLKPDSGEKITIKQQWKSYLIVILGLLGLATSQIFGIQPIGFLSFLVVWITIVSEHSPVSVQFSQSFTHGVNSVGFQSLAVSNQFKSYINSARQILSLISASSQSLIQRRIGFNGDSYPGGFVTVVLIVLVPLQILKMQELLSANVCLYATETLQNALANQLTGTFVSLQSRGQGIPASVSLKTLASAFGTMLPGQWAGLAVFGVSIGVLGAQMASSESVFNQTH